VKTFLIAVMAAACAGSVICSATAADPTTERATSKQTKKKPATDAATGLPLQPVKKSAGPRRGGKPIEEPKKTEGTEPPSGATN
jgi:hypothetical protein